MPAITAQDGPVAVTGAAGYIGAHVVKNLVEHGYTVRACVRDASRVDKTAHLTAMSGGNGSVEVVGADMLKEGAYDKAFAGCSAVFHVAADLGHDPKHKLGRDYPDFRGGEGYYQHLIKSTQWVLDSAQKAGTVKRVIYTSSGAAVKGPGPKDYLWSEKDFCGAGGYTPADIQKKWGGKQDKYFTNKRNPYGKGKMDCELLCYDWGKKTGIDVVTIIPEHVLGPLLCKAHDGGWQHDLGAVYCGEYQINQLWGVTDVRDCADAYRLAAESRNPVVGNGSRYFTITPADFGGAPTPPQLIEQLKSMYPEVGPIAAKGRDGGFMAVKTSRAQDELGLRYHNVMDTYRDTIESLKALGTIKEIQEKMAKAKSKM